MQSFTCVYGHRLNRPYGGRVTPRAPLLPDLVYLLARAAIKKRHKRGGLDKRNSFLMVLKAEFQGQGVGRVGSSESSVTGSQTAVFSPFLTWSSLCMCPGPISSYRDTLMTPL